MIKTVTLLIFTFIALSSTAQVVNTKSTDQKMLNKSKEIVKHINDQNYDEILASFPLNIRRNIPKNELVKYVDIGKQLINEYGIGKDEFILKRLFLQPIQNGDTVSIIYFDFPFPQPKDKYSPSEHLISVGFMENYGEEKIVSLQVRPNAYAPPIQEPTISKLSMIRGLDIENVSAYRIYYSEGVTNENEYGKNKGVFALQGRESDFRKSQIKKFSERLFKELKSIELPTPIIFNGFIEKEGDPEFIQAEYMLDGLEYGLRIYLNLEGDDVATNSKDKVILIRQMQFANLGYEYIIKQKEFPEIVEIFKNIRDKDWGNEYLINP